MKKTLTSIGIVIGMFLILSCGSNNSSTNYQVAISASPEEGGTVSPNSGQHEEGTSLEIIAMPSEDWKFVRWEGDYNGTNDSTTITVDSAKSIMAVFKKKKYPLTINTEGEGAVIEQVVLTNSTKDYDHGTIVELRANPAEGWEFVEWKGALTGSDNPTQLTVEEAKEVTAVFEKKSFALTVNITGEGSVTKSPDQTEYKYNAKVDLTAEPAKGWEFVEWKGGITSADSLVQVTVDKQKEVTAIFKEAKYTLGTNSDGNGKITLIPDLESYEYNTQVKVVANAEDGSSFIKWEEGLTGNENPGTLSMNKNLEVKAIFKTFEEALISDFYGSFIVNGFVNTASVSLNNTLPTQILLKKIIVTRSDGSTSLNETVNEIISSNGRAAYSISFGNPTPLDQFEKYTVKWVCEYYEVEEEIIKIGKVSTKSDATNSHPSSSDVVELHTVH